jgi:hypothetical protein
MAYVSSGRGERGLAALADAGGVEAAGPGAAALASAFGLALASADGALSVGFVAGADDDASADGALVLGDVAWLSLGPGPWLCMAALLNLR